jgi:hypothetical protein
MRHSATRLLALALVLLVVSGPTVGAQSQPALERARAHFEAGRALYSLGDFEAALREFVAGYQLTPRRMFLVNIGQAYRKLNNTAKAREMYERYLAEADPGDPLRDEVVRLLAALGPASQGHAPDHGAAQASSDAAPPPTATDPAPATGKVLVPVTQPPRSSRRRLWWIAPAGALVLAGVAVGIYFAVRPPNAIDCGAAGLGCLDSTGR